MPGRNDFEQSTDAERDAVIDDYLHILARLHALDIEPFVDAGIMRAATPGRSRARSGCRATSASSAR